jgi:hypothetical protein
VLLLLLACALSLGGWFVVAPTLATSPAQQAIAIETPPSGTRLGATPAPPPERPLPSLAPVAASAASGAGDKAMCGADQEAIYQQPKPDPDDGMIHVEMPQADPDGIVRRMPGEIKPAGVGYTGAMRRIDAALRASADPFDRAMADWLDLDQITPPVVRADALVQDALAVDDPRVYGLAYSTCHPSFAVAVRGTPLPASAPSPGCARLSATRWAQLDPGNATPWLWALSDAQRTGDAAAAREALSNMASSSRMDLHPLAGAAAVARLQLADADLAAQSSALVQAIGIEPPPAAPLTTRCHDGAGGDAALASTCSRIAELLYDHSDSLLWHAIGGSVHKLATGDPSWLDRAHREQRSTTPAQPAAVNDTPCGAQRGFLKRIVRMDAVGQLKLAQEARRAASAP